MFLSGFFQSPERNKTRSRKVVIDVKRNEETIAVDVVRGSGGRLNINKRFTTKEYVPPVYQRDVVHTNQTAFILLAKKVGRNNGTHHEPCYPKLIRIRRSIDRYN